MLVNVWDDNTPMVSRLDISQKNPVMQNRPNTSKHPALHSAVGLNREVDRFVMETRQCGILHTFDIAQYCAHFLIDTSNPKCADFYVLCLTTTSIFSKQKTVAKLAKLLDFPLLCSQWRGSHEKNASIHWPVLLYAHLDHILILVLVIKQYQTINAFLVFTGSIWIICYW